MTDEDITTEDKSQEPEVEKNLTLKSLQKDVGTKFGQIEGQVEATDTKVVSLIDKIDQMTANAKSSSAKMEMILEALTDIKRSGDAKDNPVSMTPRGVSADTLLTERDQMSEFKQHAGTDEDPGLIQTSKYSDVGTLEFKNKAEVELFMKESVKVRIQTTAEKDAAQLFDISVNGMGQIFRRGMTYVVPRYFLEGLARAKPMTFENEEYRLADNTQAVRYPSSRGLKYQFDVIEDRNPHGEAWLNMVLNQP